MNAISAQHADSELRKLVHRRVRVQQQGQASAGSSRLNIDEKYNAQYLSKMRQCLSLPEIAVLYRASGVRQKGLALASSGDTVIGANLIRQARGIFSDATLCNEALVFMESFQLLRKHMCNTSDGNMEKPVFPSWLPFTL